ncbi:MAG: peptide chain release factor N(5)-glutamine methyltransferase [Bacteroidaceae bacterium]|nr:peptide chain release factor N(5)-glutamine methyltransferase [Bacteroidaceae bacterium]
MNHRELISALTPLHGAGEARAIVRLVLEERFGLSQTDLLLGKDTTLSPNDRAEFEKIAQRLLAGEPVQYVLGCADFCGRRFRVTPDVLIPRPETEDLVAWATDELRMLNDEYSEPSSTEVLDLCTGSGCIAISLALAFPSAHVTGIDISAPALAIARDNAKALGASNVDFFEHDILPEDPSPSPRGGREGVLGREGVFSPPRGELERGLSLLTANPPYVRRSEAAGIHATVLNHEPSLALFVSDDDPLIFYHSIAQIGLRSLRSGAPVLVELNTALAAETRSLFESFSYADIEIRDDRFGRPRMLRAVRR